MNETKTNLDGPMDIDRTAGSTTAGRPVAFIRLVLQCEDSNENVKRVSEIAAVVETEMANLKGAKLLKLSQELVHAIETYNSVFPPLPRAKRIIGPSAARSVEQPNNPGTGGTCSPGS